MKRVSIKDVAREAGVSATTVSYVLNRNPGETISAETTQRVLEAVRVDAVFDELQCRISALEAAIKSPDDDALDEVKELSAWWEERRAELELFTWSPDMRALSYALA